MMFRPSSACVGTILLISNVYHVAASETLNDNQKNSKLSSLLKPYMETNNIFSVMSAEKSIVSRCIAVDVTLATTEDRDAAFQVLEDTGFNKSACFANVCSGCVPPNQLAAFSELQEIAFVHPVLPQLSTGNVTTQGDLAMKTNLVRQRLGVDGTGLKIGVLSDSFNCLGQYDPNTLSYQDDVASGDLPNNVEVLLDYTYDTFLQLNQIQSRPCTDEGRAMLQLIHDVAPGAQLAFYSGWGGKAAMAVGINSLAAAGCNIIVDDLSFPDAAFFQDDLPAIAVGTVTAQGVAYFAAASNVARNSWESAFIDSGKAGPGGGQLHDFGNGLTYQELYIDSQGLFIFQWDQPFGSTCNLPFCPGSTNDLDIYAVNADNAAQVLSSTDGNISKDPIELLVLPPGTWRIQIELTSGSVPGLMKWIFLGMFGSNSIPGVNRSTLFGHANAASAAGVGAAFWGNTPVYGTDPARQEPQTAAGGTPILFDTQGNRLSTAEVRMQPRFVGPDGGSTTFFGAFSNNNHYFYGTSAAAPHVAAGAALMLQINPTLTPQQVYEIIENTALDMDDTFTKSVFDTGFDFGTGFGFVDFEMALRQAQGAPTMSPSIPTSGNTAPSTQPSTAGPTVLSSQTPATSGAPSSQASSASPTTSSTLLAPSMTPSSGSTAPSPKPTTDRPTSTPASSAPSLRAPSIHPTISASAVPSMATSAPSQGSSSSKPSPAPSFPPSSMTPTQESQTPSLRPSRAHISGSPSPASVSMTPSVATFAPTQPPSTLTPSKSPTETPTQTPTLLPETNHPTSFPTGKASSMPTIPPSIVPTTATMSPSDQPSSIPSISLRPIIAPTRKPARDKPSSSNHNDGNPNNRPTRENYRGEGAQEGGVGGGQQHQGRGKSKKAQMDKKMKSYSSQKSMKKLDVKKGSTKKNKKKSKKERK